jgi:SAM-dependent methyltransferase
MIDEHYANPKLAAVYDEDSGWDEARDYYLALAPETPIDILDLGCGTGLLCEAYAARGHRVTGVDPAQAMLDQARKKTNGANIEWICATAQSHLSIKRFDLIIMTGHAFQVFLTDEGVVALFKTMCHHLKPHGRAVFESRNPAIDWPRVWNLEINTSASRQFVALSRDQETITFDMHYRFGGETLSSRSTLRFMTRVAIEKQLTAAGLKTFAVKGDWSGGEFDERTSQEMIFEVRLA